MDEVSRKACMLLVDGVRTVCAASREGINCCVPLLPTHLNTNAASIKSINSLNSSLRKKIKFKMSPSIGLDHTTPGPVPETTQTPAGFARTSDLFSLGNRTTVITGGGRGVGIVLAGAVLEAGGDVVCLDLHLAPSEPEWGGLQKQAAAGGVQVSYIQCDITNEESTKAVLEQVAAESTERNKPLRGLITCAGIQQMTPALEYPVDGFRKMMEVK